MVRQGDAAWWWTQLAFVVLLTLGSVRGSAAGPLPPVASDDGITVINVPPQFSGFSIRTQDGLNYIDVVVSDYNAWSDIFRVSVDVLDDLRAPVAEVAFQQYPDNVTLTRQPQFTEPLGSYLVRTLSSAAGSQADNHKDTESLSFLNSLRAIVSWW